jgi:hypothetical protein
LTERGAAVFGSLQSGRGVLQGKQEPIDSGGYIFPVPVKPISSVSRPSHEIDESIRMEMAAGWVSVLMAMKAAVDHGVDLRNHDASRSWSNGYADN